MIDIRLPWVAAGALLACFPAPLRAQWLETGDVKVSVEETELGGPVVALEYELKDATVSPAAPVYVFVRFRRADGECRLLPPSRLRGNGHGLVESPGRKKILWWGAAPPDLGGLDGGAFRVRALPMVRVPAGRFTMKMVPGAGHDQTKALVGTADLTAFCVARCETTVGMYADYLKGACRKGGGWNPRMANAERCGIERADDGSFRVAPGRELHPVTYVSWYDAMAFLEWCGLRLPTEAEMTKAIRGGHFLDGDASGKVPNPLPERKYPWGNETPDEGGVFRCNFDGDADGFAGTAPVGSFAKFNSPYGACDLAGNVSEWTLDFYATAFHAGIDGYRIIRGGSWMDVPEGCDAATAPTCLPLKTVSIAGFRGVFGPPP